MRDFLLYLFLLFTLSANAQKFIKISGYIKDSANNESLIGANIININTQKGTTANNYGYFCIIIPAQTSTLLFSYVGYCARNIQVNCNVDTIVNVLLNTCNNMKEVVIRGSNNYRIYSPQMSLETISSKTVSSLPAIMGEPDLTRTLLLLPGVTFGSESTSGYFVRGGSSDQNLILIDGVPVYNAYHLYGFFSVFNTDAVNNAKFYKGGIPASYGGRLSSVLDVQMKEGNSQKYSGEIELGIVSSKILIEGPIKKGKTSFIITGRRSMMDIFPQNLSYKLTEINGMNKVKRDVELQDYYFYDLSAKINHTFSNRSRLFLSFYNGKDDYLTQTNDKKFTNSINWGNTTSSVRWNHLFTKDLFSNITIYYSKYNYLTQNSDFYDITSTKQTEYGYSRKYSSGIQDYSGKTDFEYKISGHALKFGTQYIAQFVKPGISTFFQSSNNPENNIDTTYNFNKNISSGILYIEDNFKLLQTLSINMGLHIAGYYTEYKLYKSLQPRLSISYQPITNIRVKASYSRMGQNLHLLSANTLGGPSDIWVPITKKVKPAYSDQFVLGTNFNFSKQFSITIEAFNKKMYNLLMYKEGASYLIEETDWQDKVETGKGKAHGIEFSVNKELGNTTGWISYTYSKSLRTFTNINNGVEFPYTYDRRHDISIALMHKLNNKFDIGSVWVYATGHAFTIANTFIYNELHGGNYLKYYSSINGYRMPSYHRLDVSINYHNEIKMLKYTIRAGAYNVYNRSNPYCIIDSPDGIRVQTLFPILPYLSFALKF